MGSGNGGNNPLLQIAMQMLANKGGGGTLTFGVGNVRCQAGIHLRKFRQLKPLSRIVRRRGW